MHQHAGLLAAGDSMGVGILLALSTGDHHFNVTAFEGLQILRGDLFLQRHQSVETILDHIVRHLFHLGGRRARTRRVDKSECGREPRLTHDIQGLLEILFGLSGEADDDVGGNLRIRHGLTHLLQNRHELGCAVGTAHGPQNLVGA